MENALIADTGEVLISPLSEASDPIPACDAVVALDDEKMFLHVMLAHEDLPTGLRAKQVLERMEVSLGVKPKFVVNLWKFNMLNDPELAARAIQEAVHADILFVSCHGGKDLATGFYNWLEQCAISRGDRPCALVVSLDSKQEHTIIARAILGRLQEFCVKSGMELFTHFGETTSRVRDWTFQEIQQRAADAVFAERKMFYPMPRPSL